MSSVFYHDPRAVAELRQVHREPRKMHDHDCVETGGHVFGHQVQSCPIDVEQNGFCTDVSGAIRARDERERRSPDPIARAEICSCTCGMKRRRAVAERDCVPRSGDPAEFRFEFRYCRSLSQPATAKDLRNRLDIVVFDQLSTIRNRDLGGWSTSVFRAHEATSERNSSTPSQWSLRSLE